jgi:4,5-DOPA dioxygenase extradiol
MKLKELHSLTEPLTSTSLMPVLFMGHGSPMNAIEENEFTQGFRTMGKDIPTPKAILCVSAHWETNGTFVTAMEQPRTIHDFGGFPKALFDVQYPAPGSTAIAKETATTVSKTTVQLDDKWGLDHGAWSVIKHLYPHADIPVLQLSLDYKQAPQYHFELAKELAVLRKKGVLIIGSGNIVHNLGMVAWDKIKEPRYGYDWALEVKEKINHYILNNDFKPLIDFRNQGTAFNLAIPTPEHYLPLLYSLALKEEKDKLQLFNDTAIGGSLTMTSIKIG